MITSYLNSPFLYFFLTQEIGRAIFSEPHHQRNIFVVEDVCFKVYYYWEGCGWLNIDYYPASYIRTCVRRKSGWEMIGESYGYYTNPPNPDDIDEDDLWDDDIEEEEDDWDNDWDMNKENLFDISSDNDNTNDNTIIGRKGDLSHYGQTLKIRGFWVFPLLITVTILLRKTFPLLLSTQKMTFRNKFLFISHMATPLRHDNVNVTAVVLPVSHHSTVWLTIYFMILSIGDVSHDILASLLIHNKWRYVPLLKSLYLWIISSKDIQGDCTILSPTNW